MNKKRFIKAYFEEFGKCAFEELTENSLIKVSELLTETKNNNKKVLFAGNGASATIANHCALDYTKQAKIRSISFSDSGFLTAYGNDYGYDCWVEKALEHYADKGDIVVLISSSGKSPNILNAASFANKKGLKTITFSGFEIDNPLKQLGEVNFWVNSKSYNIVETTHMLWLVTICDLIIGKKEYAVS
jgi:D-sedoheptulose 7-phosphate isomerase